MSKKVIWIEGGKLKFNFKNLSKKFEEPKPKKKVLKTTIIKENNKPRGLLLAEAELMGYSLGRSRASERNTDLVSSGVAMVVGIIALVVVSNVINNSVAFMNGGVIPGSASTIIGFITVGVAIAIFVAAFKIIEL